MGFYASHKDKAIELVKQQLKDGWSQQDILDYWYALEDPFFVITVIKHYFDSSDIG